MMKYGLIGKKLNHSFSKKYFTEKFEKENIEASFHNFELANIGEIGEVFKTEGLRGLNVTIPYKSDVIPYLNEIDDVVKEIGAVNTIKIQKDDQGNIHTKGYNTDVFGFAQMIKPFFKSHHERALILGTGGASKAVSYVLKRLGVDVRFVSRNPENDVDFSYEDLNQNVLKYHPLIVNTTPVGMYPNTEEEIELPYQYIDDSFLIVDLIYNPEVTKFMEKSKERGAKVLNGLTMLHQQAEESWRIYNEPQLNC